MGQRLSHQYLILTHMVRRMQALPEAGRLGMALPALSTVHGPDRTEPPGESILRGVFIPRERINMNNVTPDQFPAAAGGNPRAQLRHLRTYRAFQRQDQFEKARIDWKTVITKSESRRHVARNLHAKINQKAGGLQPADRMNTPEEQESMVRLARRIGNQERVSPGDGLGLSWNLRRRMLQARYPRRPSAQGPGFPPEVRKRRAEQERLKRLLTMQGASGGGGRPGSSCHTPAPAATTSSTSSTLRRVNARTASTGLGKENWWKSRSGPEEPSGNPSAAWTATGGEKRRRKSEEKGKETEAMPQPIEPRIEYLTALIQAQCDPDRAEPTLPGTAAGRGEGIPKTVDQLRRQMAQQLAEKVRREFRRGIAGLFVLTPAQARTLDTLGLPPEVSRQVLSLNWLQEAPGNYAVNQRLRTIAELPPKPENGNPDWKRRWLEHAHTPTGIARPQDHDPLKDPVSEMLNRVIRAMAEAAAPEIPSHGDMAHHLLEHEIPDSLNHRLAKPAKDPLDLTLVWTAGARMRSLICRMGINGQEHAARKPGGAAGRTLRAENPPAP